MALDGREPRDVDDDRHSSRKTQFFERIASTRWRLEPRRGDRRQKHVYALGGNSEALLDPLLHSRRRGDDGRRRFAVEEAVRRVP